MNVKNELESLLKSLGNISMSCAKITYYDYKEHNYNLRLNYTKEELSTFLDSLNFECEDNFTARQMYGTIWLNDGSWLIRKCFTERIYCREYWDHQKVPEIPAELIL